MSVVIPIGYIGVEERRNLMFSSPRQIRQALTQVGLRAGVEAAVATGSQDLKDWWEFATSLERQHPMVLAMAQGIGVTEQQLDDLFVLASTL